ncbi:HPC2 multi-domain protein [Streptomyces sp. NPDC007983]|uniref:HPC2 multi-domain protein n=1 Tax=Streptomyces sp. NPDC007983 TaxID=3364800 RepID=UPI0036E518F3
MPPAGQDTVGNGAVAAARRAEPADRQPPAAEAAPAEAAAASGGASEVTAPDAKARPGPDADPKFGALKKDVRHKKRSVAASHPPPRTEAASAQDAAQPPKDDEEAQGKTANAEKMDEAKPKEFDKDAFIRAVEKAIAEKAPKNLDEADKFADSGKAEEVRAEVQGQVGQGKSDSAEQIATTTAAPPDTSAAVPKKVVPMTPDRPPGAPGTPNPANAVPDKLPPSATDLSAGPERVDRQMADAQVTETQLKKSNEPTFKNALGEKKTAERHSDVAPGRMRGHEKKELRAATARAQRLGAAAMGAMGAQRVRAGQQVGAGKDGAKGRDEEKRAQVTSILQGVFDTMKKEVEAILDGLDKLVDDQFGREEKAARDAFTAEHKRKMEEYKDRRYSGWSGKARWLRDLFAGLPAEADKIFEEARDNYVRRMRQVISNVADTIGTELNRAKRRIAQGRTEMQAAVRKLPADLRSIGQQAAAEFTDKFDELTQSVDDKGTQLVDTLATKYTDALKSVDDEIAAEKEKNKGLVAKAVDAVKSVINTILELKRLLLSVLAKAASAIMLILKDPIGFLRNLVSAVGAGLRQFLANIGRHLQQGIMSWLLGKTAEAGIELPSKFDAQGVLKMLASVLGLTWQNIRSRIVRKVPKMEPAVAAAETAVPLVSEVRKRGVAGMWDDLKTRVGDLKKDLLDKVIAYVTPTIIQAGIMWVLSLLNPASAFVRAVKLIIDFVRFIVTQARQIFEFVNSVLDAVIAIARGGSGGVPGLIERALARSIPVLLGVLAAVLGVAGIAAKVKQIVQAMSKPVNRAVDWVIDKIVGLVKKLWAKIKSKFEKKKPTKPKPKRRPDRKRPGGPRRRKRPDQRRRPDRRRPKRKGGKGKAGPDQKRPGEGHTLKPDWGTVSFSADGHAHRLFVAASGGKATLMVASTEQPVVTYLNRVIADEKTNPEVKQKAQAALQLATTAGGQANEIAKLAVHVPEKGEKAAKQKMSKEQAELSAEQKQLADLLKEIFEQKNSIEPWLGKPVADVPKGLLGYDVRPDSGTFLFGESYSFLQIQRAGGFGSADGRSFPMVHVDPHELVQKGAGILRADMEVIKAYRAAIATHQDKLKLDEAPDLEGNPDGLANQLEKGANKQRPFNMGIRKQMEAIVNFLQKGGDLTGVEVKVGKKRVDYAARMSIDGRAQHVMIEYKHVTGKLSTERRAELVTKLTAQLTGQIEGGRGKYTTHIIDWPEFSGLDTRSQAAFREVIEDAREVGAKMGIDVRWNG